jgi:hypothetical protein
MNLRRNGRRMVDFDGFVGWAAVFILVKLDCNIAVDEMKSGKWRILLGYFQKLKIRYNSHLPFFFQLQLCLVQKRQNRVTNTSLTRVILEYIYTS